MSEEEVINKEREKARMNTVLLNWNQRYQFDVTEFTYINR